ncbi:RagB/SusD family nutrient uptake outer membrane protein [Puteibacter caeruleilacunae]|nr:RagB/SusD family nutrient uptake outer membrane protein [Puteibacter caeruleilacunae]
MKKFTIYIKYLSLSCLLAFNSCDDALDKLPDNRVELSSVSDIEGLMANALPDACFYSFTHSMSDNAGDGGISGINILTNEEAYKFMDSTTEGQDTPLFYWISCYEAIALNNLAIEFIEKIKDDEQEYKKYKHLYGEALVARAYNHFMLVNLYCNHYDPESSKTDLGIPYVTEPETKVLVDYKRGTVAEVYDKIKKDLEKGMPLLNDELQDNPQFHFTTKSAHAFASRFYLYLGEWQKVVEHCKPVLGSNVTTKLRDWNGEYKQFTRSELLAHYTSSNEPANLLIRVGMSTYPYYYAKLRHGLTETIRDYIYSSDLPSKGRYSYSTVGWDEPDRIFINKYNSLFKRTSINAEIGHVYINNPLFSIEEVLFNFLEAKVMQEKYFTVVRELNKFYSKRVDNFMVGYDPNYNIVTEENILGIYTNRGENLESWYPINQKQKVYLRCLLHARRAEFMFEGLRWFDIKRFRLPVIHYDADRNKYQLTAQDSRKAIQIPESAIALGMKPNPRNK